MSTVRSLFADVPLPLLALDLASGADARVLDMTDQFADLANCPRDEALSLGLAELMADGEAVLAELLSGRECNVRLRGTTDLPGPLLRLQSHRSTSREDTLVVVASALREPPFDLVPTQAPAQGQLLLDMVDKIQSLLYIKGLDGRYLFVNLYFAERLGMSREQVIGKTDLDLWVHDAAVEYMANDRRVLSSGRAMEFEERIRSAPHTDVGMWLSLKFPLVDELGEVYAVGGSSTDISDRNRNESLIRAARDEAQRANRAKSEFLSRMSHELRTPLNSIIGFGQLMQMNDLPARERATVTQIVKAGRHLLALINDVLDVSRIESGTHVIATEPVHACDPLMEAIELVRPLATEKQIDIAFDLHAILFKFVIADFQRLKQVLLNVLVNAVKYNVPGGSITIGSAILEERVRFSIADTGPGIDRGDLERLFLPFERLDATSTNVEGTGLGLALSKTLIEAMGGAIGVERTEPGVGSVFFVDVELTEDVDHAFGITAPADPQHVVTPDLNPMSIVYIEDNLASLDLVERILERQGGVTLIPAMQGRLGVQLVGLHKPDLVLLDLHLPDIDGEEVLRRLKADPVTAAIPVVVLSADATPSRADRLHHQGAEAYVTKPLDIFNLLDTVRMATGHRHG